MTNLHFDRVELDKVKNEWDHILDTLPSFHRRNADVDWSWYNLYECLTKGYANLIWIKQGQENVGYVVYNWLKEMKGTSYMNLWLYYLYPEYRQGLKATKEITCKMLSYLTELCRLAGAEYLSMPTTNQAWRRLLGDFVQVKSITLYRSCSHG